MSRRDDRIGVVVPPGGWPWNYIDVGAVQRSRLDVGAVQSQGSTVANLAGVDQNDSMVASGVVAYVATLAGVDRNDSMVASGSATFVGSIAATNRNDSMVAPATASFPATLAATNQNDVFVGTAQPPTGTLAASGHADTFIGTASPRGGIMAATGRPDTFAGSAAFTASGSITASSRNDSMTASAHFTAAGTLAAAAGNDAFAGYAGQYILGHLAAAGRADTFAGSGIPGAGSILAAAGRADTFHGIGHTSALATLAATNQNDVFVGVSSHVAYHIYGNTGAADPIDYDSPITSTSGLAWTSFPLTYPGVWRFGVRAYYEGTSLEEMNLDAAVTIILDASGNDISTQPKAPDHLKAFAKAGGTIRVEWSYNTINPLPVPSGFHIYIGTTGVPNYGSPEATVSFGSAVAGSFFCDLPSLADGTTYAIGVRAYNAIAEEANTITIFCAADATGPGPVVGLTATAV
jgi:hypothetical protein